MQRHSNGGMSLRRQAAYFGVLTALALIFSYVETFIPVPIGIPGIKLGLANLVVVIALYKMDILSAYTLAVLRVGRILVWKPV